jgi:hypothetical protein
MFTKADNLCRVQLLSQKRIAVDQIKEVYQQIVSGVNYKIRYTAIHLGQKLAECTVFTQSWTNTVQILGFANV